MGCQHLNTRQVEVDLPPLECSPNFLASSVRKRIARDRARADYRFLCRCLYMQGLLGFSTERARLSLDFYMGGRRGDGRYRPLDQANAIASFKWGQDALVDAKVIPNDDGRHLEQGPVSLHRGKQAGGRCCVVVTIEAI